MKKLASWVVLLLITCAPAFAEKPVSSVYKKVFAAVVTIETEQEEIDPNFPGQPVMMQGLGSGVLISDDGKVLTAAHVVQTANSILVHFLNGERIPARVATSEPAADLALLQLERRPTSKQVASLGDSDRTEVGERVFVVGAPMGMSHTLTVGHVSAKRKGDETFGGLFPSEVIQTDTAINTGNSGGPMFNMKGEVIGIVSYIVSQSGGSEGLGFVMTSNMARKLLLDQPSMWSGLQGQFLAGPLAQIFNLPQETGLLVERVADRSPASYVGLRAGTIPATFGDFHLLVGGDIILGCQDISLDEENSSERIRDRLANLRAGEDLKVRVLRGGKILDLSRPYYPDLLRPRPLGPED